jgi:DNA-binding MarR family transcriptional regulator
MNTFTLEALVTVAARGRFYDATSSVAIKTIIDDGLVERRITDDKDDPNLYKLTEKGRIMVNALVSVPQPVIAYTMPGKQ